VPHSIRSLSVALALTLAIATAGCGNLSSSGGGISGTSVVFGTISGLGSIIVNGIEFDISKAQVTIEENPATAADLEIGMIVTVRGKVNARKRTGTAKFVAFENILSGPVEGVNVADGTFASLSQLIISDAQTVFVDTTLATLAAGEYVEVSGVRDADGAIRASRVLKVAGIGEIEVKGTVANLDTANQTFQFGALTLDYSGAVFENFTTDDLADGLFVEAEAEQPPVGSVFLATGLELFDPELLADPGNAAVFEGIVTSIVSAEEVVLNATQRVLITADTLFEGGTADDVVLNALVDVDGLYDRSGALVAEEIEIVAPPAGP